MKKLTLFLTMLVAFCMVNAQPEIKFDSQTYDFGKIKEEGGKVTGRFEFTNVGNQDLILVNVKPGCGCTAANYSKEPVAPGQKGFIEATYNPYNRPGAFNKNIRVTTNEPRFEQENAAPHMIFIKGEVLKRPPTVFEKAQYTNGNGMARIKTGNVSHNMMNTEVVRDTFKVRNFWTKPVTFTLDAKHDYITEVGRNFGGALQPGQEGHIILQYDAAKRNAFGQVRDFVTFTTNDSLESRKAIHYAVNIKEDFSKLTEKQLKMAPAVQYSAVSHHFGDVQKNTQNTTTISVKNIGRSPLAIRSVNANSGYFKVTSDMKEVPVNGTATVTITFKASNRAGRQKATVDIITNDPANPVQVVDVDANVL
ncbi:MAG: DUF1573 domain-containing protein [Bacteroidales bacterium]|nr:DUF1573 domain-containing protein [Bacteroidales bacterium]